MPVGTTKRKMVIITINIPENYIDIIDKYICSKDYGNYTSRSEFVRTAVINQLKEDLKSMELIANKLEEFEDQTTRFIKVPYENGEAKIYKIVRRLE